MKVDLKSMNRKQLEKLQKDVEKALLGMKQRDLKEARKAAEKAAAGFGFSLGDLATSAKPAGKKQRKKPASTGVKSKPKFANPANASQTWTGKGRQPNWYRAEIEKGTAPEKMAI